MCWWRPHFVFDFSNSKHPFFEVWKHSESVLNEGLSIRITADVVGKNDWTEWTDSYRPCPLDWVDDSYTTHGMNHTQHRIGFNWINHALCGCVYSQRLTETSSSTKCAEKVAASAVVSGWPAYQPPTAVCIIKYMGQCGWAAGFVIVCFATPST